MSIEAMKLALFALDIVKIHYTQNRHINEAIAALKERLAQPHETTLKEFHQFIYDDPKYHIWAKEKEALAEKSMREVQRLGQEIKQEPVAWLVEFENGEQELHFDEQSVGEIHTPLYTHPPQRTEQGPVGSVVRWVDGSLIHGWFGEPPPEGTLLYAHSPQRTWVGLEGAEAGWFCYTDFLNAKKYTKKQRQLICCQLLSEAQSWDIGNYQLMMHDSTKIKENT